MNKMCLKATTLLVGLVLATSGWANEGPQYEVAKKLDGFELRRYEPYLVAETEVRGTFDTAAYSAFKVLFDYIDGNNRSRETIEMTSPVTQKPGGEKIEMTSPVTQRPSGEKIEMTSPVTQRPSGEKIDMTSPVTQRPAGEKIDMTSPVTQAPKSEGGSSTYALGFTMPAKYTLATLPEPLDPRVKIREVPGQLMAARTYSGSWSKSAYRKNESALRSGLAVAGLRATGPAVFARYNHPLTRGSQRRNEILIPVEPIPAGPAAAPGK
jgi:hypothetical protein